MTSLWYKRTGTVRERKDKDLKLRMIPTSVHGTLDYLASGVNVAFPSLLKLDDAPAAVLIPRLDGIAGASYSLVTNKAILKRIVESLSYHRSSTSVSSGRTVNM